MLLRLSKRGILFFLLFVVLFALACTLPAASTPNSPPIVDSTKVALEIQATNMALQLTQAALNSQPAAQPTVTPPQPTATEAVIAVPAEVQETPTQDVESLIRSANVLVYENTDEYGIGMWVQETLDMMGIKYTQTGSYSGRFMEYLNSGTEYDLIIVNAEAKDRISGEFWDVINTRLTRDKTALIAEVWYLDTEASGPISKILSGCGIRYQKDYRVADSIYWWESTHPIFNEPNTVLPLLHYNRYWENQTGDQIRLGGSGDAVLLAGLAAQKSSQEAVLATCYDGRVIIQTFSDHDYDQADIIPLWENYIHYTLKNHFLALP
jgi:hypothetical protein